MQRKTKSATAIAVTGALFIMGFQVAGKAARDALFLTSYRPSQLPPMIVAGALSAIVLGVLNSHLLSLFAPWRFVPALMVLSAVLQTVEWLAYPHAPGPTAICVYIHVVALGAVITSGFWSVINEQFDPYTAKQSFGRIAGAGTAGGVVGGFVAERLAVWAPPQSILLAMAIAQVITAFVLLFLPHRAVSMQGEAESASRLLRHSSYFRNLSAMVLIGTFSAALLDYVLKSDARHTLGPGEPLLRFFALFYTGTAVLAFLVQTGFTAQIVSTLGLGAAVSTLPASVLGSGLVAGLIGGFPLVVIARAIETVVRGSVYRAGYELLYTPMVPAEKRALKSVNDVTIDRLGDAIGGAFAQLIIYLGPISSRILLLTAAGMSATGWLLSRHLHRGYVRSLERSLEHYAAEGGPEPEPDTALPPLLEAPAAVLVPDERDVAVQWISKSARDRLKALMSRDLALVRDALADPQPLERGLLPYVVPMLAWEPVRDRASAAIQSVAPSNVGQLSDFLLDIVTDHRVRVILPGLVAAGGGSRAADALVRCLSDDDAEIRNSCGRGLDFLRQTTDLPLDGDRVFDAIRQELRLRAAGTMRAVDLQHVFVLLSIVLPREPVRIAFEALGSGDENLRGLAFEYLETALPGDISATLLEIVKAIPETRRATPPHDAVRQELTRALGRAEAP